MKTGCIISRRKVLSMGLITMASGIIPSKAISAVEDILVRERILCFYNLYTKETLEVVYWKDGSYVPEGTAKLNHILRDIRTGKVKTIDRSLLDLLFALQQNLGNNEPFHIISGYRTPQSNALLSKKKKGVAKYSLHMYGKAVDIRIPGHKLRDIRRAAMKLKGGGVGYYPQSNFIHVDTGNIRYWWG
ncbi:MAG: YcbK family protein [Nitrospirota bacterium]